MRPIKTRIPVAASMACVLATAAYARASAALNPSDLIVSLGGSSSVVREYTPVGTLVQSWTIPSSGGTEYARDLGASSGGNIAIYNGTFSPSLTVLNPSTGVTTNYSFAGWSTVNNIHWGGLAVAGNYAYATDNETAGDGSNQNGVVRFNLADGSAERFLAGTDTTSVGIGLNHKLYAISPNLSPGQNVLTIMDAATMNVEKNVNLPFGLSGVTADAAGNIYGTSGQTIYKLDENGNVLGSLATNYALGGIKISPTDQLVIDNNGGQVVTSDTSLSNYSEFSVPGAGNYFTSFADFATPLPSPVPEPASVMIFGAVMTSLVLHRPRRRAASPTPA